MTDDEIIYMIGGGGIVFFAMVILWILFVDE